MMMEVGKFLDGVPFLGTLFLIIPAIAAVTEKLEFSYICLLNYAPRQAVTTSEI